MNKDNKSPAQQIDYTLLFILFLFMCVSLIAIYTAPDVGLYMATKQLVWYILGSVAIFIIMLIDFDRFRYIAWYLYGFGLLLLVGLKIAPSSIAPEQFGAVSWYSVFGLSFQPSEIMKIFLMIILAHIITKHIETTTEKTIKNDFILLGKVLGIAVIPVVLVASEPDFGTALVLLVITFCMLMISGIRWRILIGLVLTGVLFIAALTYIYIYMPYITFIHEPLAHVEPRILGWLYPHEYATDEGFQLLSSLRAIGSGQLFGKGFGNSHVDLPVAYSDFIFPIIAEQFGFLGASIVISLFFLLIYRIIHAALGTNDLFGTFICTGIIGMIAFQVFQNIGMTIRILPITGLPLPFISYGGTSLLTCMVAMGFVLNIHSRRRTYMFDDS